MKKNIIISLLLIICIVLVCYICKLQEVKETNLVVEYNNNEYTIRDENGRKINIIDYNGRKYLPITEKGLFFGKDIEISDKIKIKDIEDYNDNFVDINCNTIEMTSFTNDDISHYDYTVVFNWATWCSDCDKTLENLELLLPKLKENNIQFVGLLMDNSENISELRKCVYSKLDKKGISFVNIIPNEELEKRLQSNVKFIPNFYILDSKSRLVDNFSGEDFEISELLNKIMKIKEDACGEC